jgi:hypothetical protein
VYEFISHSPFSRAPIQVIFRVRKRETRHLVPPASIRPFAFRFTETARNRSLLGSSCLLSSKEIEGKNKEKEQTRREESLKAHY